MGSAFEALFRRRRDFRCGAKGSRQATAAALSPPSCNMADISWPDLSKNLPVPFPASMCSSPRPGGAAEGKKPPRPCAPPARRWTSPPCFCAPRPARMNNPSNRCARCRRQPRHRRGLPDRGEHGARPRAGGRWRPSRRPGCAQGRARGAAPERHRRRRWPAHQARRHDGGRSRRGLRDVREPDAQGRVRPSRRRSSVPTGGYSSSNRPAAPMPARWTRCWRSPSPARLHRHRAHAAGGAPRLPRRCRSVPPDALARPLLRPALHGVALVTVLATPLAAWAQDGSPARTARSACR